jgi:hypothetical protein
MFWIDLLFVFLFALILSSILIWGFGWRHPAETEAVGASFLFLFLILLVVMWAAGAWLVPWGPVVYDTPWLGLLLIGLFISVLILAVAAPTWKGKRAEPMAGAEEAVAATIFGIFFWILIVGLLIAAIVSYFV